MQHNMLISIRDSNKINLFWKLWEETFFEMTSDDKLILLSAMHNEISRKIDHIYMSSNPTYGEFNLINFPEFRTADLKILTKRLTLAWCDKVILL